MLNKPTVLVARCLMGEPCRYHGIYTPPRLRLLDRLARRYRVVPVCPEIMGGLPVPRPPAYIIGDRVISAGIDVTTFFLRGARMVRDMARRSQAIKFYGLRHSPSCDPRTGITARMLADDGIFCHFG
jgi:uncharacterized protein YbbK (DUF523 family)